MILYSELEGTWVEEKCGFSENDAAYVREEIDFTAKNQIQEKIVYFSDIGCTKVTKTEITATAQVQSATSSDESYFFKSLPSRLDSETQTKGYRKESHLYTLETLDEDRISLKLVKILLERYNGQADEEVPDAPAKTFFKKR